jgi:hypothetical protein
MKWIWMRPGSDDTSGKLPILTSTIWPINSQQFGREELVPIVRPCNPELAVTDKRFPLNKTRDQESPRKKYQGRENVEHAGNKADSDDLTCPFSGLVPDEDDEQCQRH